MPYAILRFQKRKAGSVAACERHNERKKEAYKSNPDIDMERSGENYHLVSPPRYTYKKEINRMTGAAGCRVRRDSVMLVETLITASPEFMHSLPPAEQRAYFAAALDFISERVGKQNIISAVVHMDETTPHMHLCFVPITKEGKLSAKTMLGNQKSLSEWQTAYHAHMSARWPELERGESSIIAPVLGSLQPFLKGQVLFMRKEQICPPPVRRAALYIRVSTEEQAKKGYSIPAQREDLEEYARANGYAIAGVFIDEGKSARKKYTARPAFMQMLEGVKRGEIDVILFIKLDRWFRNIADYYEVQKILDAHNVAWKTTQEHYDTETTNGRLYINIRLSVAQDESDRDSDRIKFVFQNKVSRGEAIFGSMPLGLKIEDKHIVPDPETAPIVRELFHHYEMHRSISRAVREVGDQFGRVLWLDGTRKMLANPLYKGVYRDNPTYCEPLIPPEEFDRVQELLKERSIRHNQTGRVYLFSGLLVCTVCGRKMAGRYCTTKRKENNWEYFLYRCPTAMQYHRCPHRKEVNEEKLEAWLLEHIQAELDAYQMQWESAAAVSPRPKVDRAAISRKLEKLKQLYIEDYISLEEYQADYKKYREKLDAEPSEPQRPDFERLRTYLRADFQAAYSELTLVQRRDFWHSIIREIRLNEENTPQIIFCL